MRSLHSDSEYLRLIPTDDVWFRRHSAVLPASGSVGDPSDWAVKDSNKILRWAHFISGLLITGYFFLMPGDGWSDTVNNVYKFAIVSFVFWTGVIRWNQPRIRRWSKARSATT
jgi:hypothetical protein